MQIKTQQRIVFALIIPKGVHNAWIRGKFARFKHFPKVQQFIIKKRRDVWRNRSFWKDIILSLVK